MNDGCSRGYIEKIRERKKREESGGGRWLLAPFEKLGDLGDVLVQQGHDG